MVLCGPVALQVGELEEALDAIKWGTDYLLNCHVEPTKFVAMFGNSEVRSSWQPTSSSHPYVSRKRPACFIAETTSLVLCHLVSEGAPLILFYILASLHLFSSFVTECDGMGHGNQDSTPVA